MPRSGLALNCGADIRSVHEHGFPVATEERLGGSYPLGFGDFDDVAEYARDHSTLPQPAAEEFSVVAEIGARPSGGVLSDPFEHLVAPAAEAGKLRDDPLTRFVDLRQPFGAACREGLLGRGDLVGDAPDVGPGGGGQKTLKRRNEVLETVRAHRA